MKRVRLALLLGLVMVLVAGFALPGCAPEAVPPEEEEVPPAVPEEEEVPPAVPAGETYEWDAYMCAGQYAHWEEENFVVLAEEIEEFTNGRLKIRIFWLGEHPYGAFDLLKAVSAGDCDIAEVPSYYTSGIEPALAAINLPFLIPSWDIWTKVHERMLDTYVKDILAENWNCRELISGLWGPENFFLTDGFITDFKSVKGKKLRSWCPETANTIEMLGGEPITVAYAELYTALQTGLVDGFCTNTLSAMRGGFFEVCPYLTAFNFAYGPCMMCANLDSWNELPADLREPLTGFLESKREWFLNGILKDDGMTLITEAITKYQMHIMAAPSDFNDECRARAFEAVHKPWLERVGPTGAEAYNEIAKIVAAEGYPMPGYEVK
jgi:TRAP-type C4-dicarboxylate transport system substrate-binding protein